MLYATVESPIGELLLLGDGRRLQGLYMQDGYRPATVSPHWRWEPDAFEPVGRQLREYFAGERTRFDLEPAPTGSAFQLDVWRALGRSATARPPATASWPVASAARRRHGQSVPPTAPTRSRSSFPVTG